MYLFSEELPQIYCYAQKTCSEWILEDMLAFDQYYDFLNKFSLIHVIDTHETRYYYSLRYFEGAII